MVDRALTTMTIGDLAAAAEVGVETVRYYQRRGLLATPQRRVGAYRHYARDELHRLRFIRRAQALGFSLDEIGELLLLQDGTDRRSIRRIAGARLQQVRERLSDLRRVARVLAHLIDDCEHAGGRPHCPIIEAIVRDED